MGTGLSTVSAACFEDSAYSCLHCTDHEAAPAYATTIASPYDPRSADDAGSRNSRRFHEIQGENPLFKPRSMVVDKSRPPSQRLTDASTELSFSTTEDASLSAERDASMIAPLAMTSASLEERSLSAAAVELSALPLLDMQPPRRSSDGDELVLQLNERCEDEVFVAIMSADTQRLKALLSRYRYAPGTVSSPQRQSARPVRFADLTWRKSPYSGCSPLHIAVLSSSAPMVEMVLSYGVDLYAKDEDGNTALAIAYALGHVEMVKLITKQAAGQFSSTPCSPCFSSAQSLKSTHSDDSRSLALSSITSATVYSSAKHRPRSSSIGSLESNIQLRGRSQSFSGVSSSRSDSLHVRFSQRNLPVVNGIAISSPLAAPPVPVEKMPPVDVAPPEKSESQSSKGTIDVTRKKSFHVVRDSGTFSVPGSVQSSSDGHDGTSSYVSDLTSDSHSKSSAAKKLRKAASKVLKFIRK